MDTLCSINSGASNCSNLVEIQIAGSVRIVTKMKSFKKILLAVCLVFALLMLAAPGTLGQDSTTVNSADSDNATASVVEGRGASNSSSSGSQSGFLGKVMNMFG